MYVSDINSKWKNKSIILNAKVKPDNWNDKPFNLWFEIDGVNELPSDCGDPFLAGLLLACMYEQEDLLIDTEISKSLLKNISNIQDIVSDWHSDLKKIKINCAGFNDANFTKSLKNKNAVFFSGGVDSSYSLLKHTQELTHLILVWGFDIGLGNKKFWETVLIKIKQTAAEMGKSLITVKTNLRTIADKTDANWGKKYSGCFWEILYVSSLVSVGLCLQNSLQHIIIPTTLVEEKQSDLDKIWSNNKLVFQHDEKISRLKKISYLSNFPSTINNLRVCYLIKEGNINCGHCEKCIRTIVAATLLGVKLNEANFTRMPVLKDIINLDIREGTLNHSFWLELMKEAKLRKNFELLNAILIAMVKRFSIYRFLKRPYSKIKKIIKAIFSFLKKK